MDNIENLTNPPVSEPTNGQVATQTISEIPNAETPRKKNKTGVIVIFIIIILALAGTITAILIMSNNTSTPLPVADNNGNNNTPAEDEKEVPLTAGIETSTINDNINMLLVNKKLNGAPAVKAVINNNYISKVMDNTIDDNDKLEDLLDYLVTYESDLFKPLDPSKYDASEDLSKYYVTFTTREEFFKGTTYIPAETVSDYYYKLFGEEAKHENYTTKRCGGFFYDKKRSVYYYGPGNACGFIPVEGWFLKNTGYAKKGNTYYADYLIAFTSASQEDAGNSAQNTRYIYAGISNTFPILRQYQTDSFKFYDVNFTFTDEDVAKVQTYRFVFEKDGNDFHFAKIIAKE